MKLFDPDAPVIQAITKYACILLSGFWWLLCCLPVITAGAATSALYSVMYRVRADGSCTTGEFFKAFAGDFKRATVLWLAVLGSAFLLAAGYWGANWIAADLPRTFVIALLCGLILVWFLALCMLFPLSAYFDNTCRNTLKNAFIVALRYYKKAVFCGAMTLLPLIAWFISPEWFLRLLFVWLLIIYPLLVWFKSGILAPLFKTLT